MFIYLDYHLTPLITLRYLVDRQTALILCLTADTDKLVGDSNIVCGLLESQVKR